jgi:hypothetical protein
VWTPEEVVIIERHWTNAKHVTDSDAVKAMRSEWISKNTTKRKCGGKIPPPVKWIISSSIIRKIRLPDGEYRFGPSGRPYRAKK